MSQVSIISAVFNAAITFRKCIESVQNQSHPTEHIIIDGCSSDGTLDIIEEYKSSFSKVISEHDRGMYDAMNKGLGMASGEIIGFLNADDLYADSEVLANVSELFQENSVDSCYGDLVYVDAIHTNRNIRYWHSGTCNFRRFYWGWMPPHPTFFVKKKIYEKYGYFNLNMGTAADYELMLRFLLKYKISCAYIPKIMIKMRTGGKSNVSLKSRIRANQKDRKAWKVNGLQPYPWTLYFKPLRKIPQWFIRPPKDNS